MNKITLSGFAGTGKYTIGKILADKLGYEFVSAGDFSRKRTEEYCNEKTLLLTTDSATSNHAFISASPAPSDGSKASGNV